ncbi:MAG: hypothetical protein SFW67_36830 [Myxococcaceae bacterium]|nr:hypothetical protein [Myxococcaceae bacterium]
MASRQRQWLGVGAGVVLVALLAGWWLSRPGASGASPATGDEADAGLPEAAGPRPSMGPPQTEATARAAASDSGSTSSPGGAEVIASFGWGSGPDDLGRERQQEGNPEGPMSLAPGPDGTLWVLDQVNQRLVKLDAKGRRVGTVPLPLQAAQDVVVTKDGSALVMDRLVDKAVAVIGPDGKPRGELPLEGKGLAEGGASTGLFEDGDDVLVEREHGDLVRLGKTSGKADPDRGEVPGRPSKDGAHYLTAMLVDAPTGLVALTAVAKATLAHRFTRQLSFGGPVLTLVLLDSDASGIAYLGAQREVAGSTPEAPRLGIVVLCIDGADGRPLGQASFPANAVVEESFRELAVSGDGSIVFLRRTEQGAQLERHRCQ